MGDETTWLTIVNKTPYTWHYSTRGRGGVHTLHGNSTKGYWHPILPSSNGLSLRYGDHSEWDLSSSGFGAPYILRESNDRKQFELVNNVFGNVVDRCPNFAKIEEEKQQQRRELERRQQEEQRRREEEESRRLEELERERRIQEQIDKDNEASQAHEWFLRGQILKAREQHHQHAQVLRQLVEGHAAQIERDELGDVNTNFEELLFKYQIVENDNLKKKSNLEDRMKTLQNELILKYLRQHQISIWSQLALDQAVGYVYLSLTEKLNVLEAVVKVTVEGDPDFEDVLSTGQDKKIEFLLSLQEQLHVANPTLARQVLVNALDMISSLPLSAKEILGQILFNNIWTPKEIKLFIGRALSMDQEIVTQILHKVCTYRLSCILALSALNEKDPVDYLQGCASYELDKDVDIILSEMQDKNYPEHILGLLEDVLEYIEEELPKHNSVAINENMIEEGKRMIISLDFAKPNIDDLKKVLIILSVAVKKCTTFNTQSSEEVQGYFPRLNQLASLLLLLLPQVEGRGCLLEIGTGEGKTCILAMFSTIQATRGAKVDVVTSSPLLAIRDQDEWRKLYSMFGVTSSIVPPPHVNECSFENHDKLVEDAYSKQVVYGTVGTFAADTLRQEFEKETTRGLRKFECVLVDEVDYMTLDSGVQVTFLSHQSSGLRHVEQVLASIWAMMSACRPIEMFETGEIWWGTRIQYFHKAAMQAVIGPESEDFSENSILLLGAELGFYSQEDLDKLDMDNPSFEDADSKAIEKIMNKMIPENLYKLFSELETTIANNVTVDCYSLRNNKAKLYGKESSHRDPSVSMLLLENGRTCEIMSEKSIIEGTVDKLKSRIKYSAECSLKSLEESKGFIVIPSFLKEYVENQLPVFAENALKAIRMMQGREYMIDKAPEAQRGGFNDADSHQYEAIIPLDFEASGVLEKNKRWGDGLQQFLEMKHQLAISQLSNVTNFMSNVHYFKRYLGGRGIFGVSGTLGGVAEKAFLAQHYKTASYIIPSHRHKKVVELPAVQVTGGNTRWIQRLCETAWRVADGGQVVLIICEDVKTADELKTKMHGQERQPNQITMYTISEKHNIEKRNFSQGNIIIATNLGGRGTDIHVQQEVNECGGLFVLLTYFPGSQRVERQVFGRTARKGNPGMVQMILNQDYLAPAYQGQSVETMRQLREEYEVSRLHSMERDELFEIEMKENLFSIFCTYLCDFDKNYTQEEKSDFIQMKDVPECFRSYRKKFDYQIALNALKESWALWLILHKEHISRHDDINTLREDLKKHLRNTGIHLLQGRSKNFYDYIKQAKSRTDLYCIDKKKPDCGAMFYWRSAAECDPFYSAVALYSQAYVTINLGKKDYIIKARILLEKAKTAVDVFLSESTNTMMLCNLSVTSDFAPHRKDTNLQTQMQARMNIFKSWKEYIENSLKTLKELESSRSDAITEDSIVYNLSKDKDPITTKELIALDEYGLGIVFQIKKKPEFCYDALGCFILGFLQVAAGVLVCTLSCGTASQFGLGLISEGVCDMIQGIKGMIQGGFDWAEWAISKAISIGVSLLCGGFGRLKKAVSAARSGAKGLITGAKCTSVITVKQCLKHATKYTVQELAKQGCVDVLSHAVDKGLKALFQKVLTQAFKDKVVSLIKANALLGKALTDLICSGIPKDALENGCSDFTIDKGCEGQMCKSVDVMTRQVIPDLMMDCTMVNKVVDGLSNVCGAVTQHIKDEKLFAKMETVTMCLQSAKYITLYVQILNSCPTEQVINETFVPKLLRTMDKLPQEKYEDQDGRHSLSDVKRLKDELINIIAESVSNSFIQACSRHLTSLMTKRFLSQINYAAGSAVSNTLGRGDTKSFFDNQLYKHNMNAASHIPCEILSEPEEKDLMRYIEDICDVDRPATALDIHVLTQSDSLEGKGIKLIAVDKSGNKLSEDYYPGKDSSADDIVLLLKKEPERTEGFLSGLKHRLCGEQSPYIGHFEILGADGITIPVNSEGQNCLYHAVVQATSKNQGDITNQAVSLRNEVKHALQENVHRYAKLLQLQKGYEETYKSPEKYTISGGGEKTRNESKKKYMDRFNKTDMSDLPEGDASVIKTYNLGMIGKHHDLLGRNNNNNKIIVNADHIPPKNTFHKALEILKTSGMLDELEKKNPTLYRMITADNRDKGLCRQVLVEDHRIILTTGNSKVAHKIREKLAYAAADGDVDKLIKMSLMVANPEISQSFRKDAGIPRGKQRRAILSKEATRQYHNIGDKLLVEGYLKAGLIDLNTSRDLMTWLDQGHLYSKNTSEYHELLNAMRPEN